MRFNFIDFRDYKIFNNKIFPIYGSIILYIHVYICICIIYSILVGIYMYAVYGTKVCVRGCDMARGKPRVISHSRTQNEVPHTLHIYLRVCRNIYFLLVMLFQLTEAVKKVPISFERITLTKNRS